MSKASVQNPVTSRSRKGNTASADPTDPRNASLPLGRITGGDFEVDDAEARRLDRWIDSMEGEALPLTVRVPFWDSQAVVAFSLSFAAGALLGVPIALYIRSVGIF